MALVDDIISALESLGFDPIDNNRAIASHNAFSEQVIVDLRSQGGLTYTELENTVRELGDLLPDRKARSTLFIEYETDTGDSEIATIASTERIQATLSQAEGNILEFSTRYTESTVVLFGINIV